MQALALDNALEEELKKTYFDSRPPAYCGAGDVRTRLHAAHTMAAALMQTVRI